MFSVAGQIRHIPFDESTPVRPSFTCFLHDLTPIRLHNTISLRSTLYPMSSTISLDEDEYRSCGSRLASLGGNADSDTTTQSQALSVNAGSTPPLSDVPSSLADHPSVGHNSRRQTSILHQLTAWLTLGGFPTDSKLPAAFQDDTEAPQGGNADLSTTDTVAIEKALVRRALARHDEAYICGLRRDIFTKLLDHARGMVGHHTVSDTNQSNPAFTGSKPDCQTYTVGDEDIQCVVAHVVRVMETLHHATMLSSRSRNGQAEKASQRRNTSDSTAILPKSLKKGPDTATSINLPQSHITSVALPGPMFTPGQPSLGEATNFGEIITGNTAPLHPAIVRIDGSGSREGAEAARDGVSTLALSAPEDSDDQHAQRPMPTTKPQAEAPSSHAAAEFEPQITSFPALRKRQGTSDWLIPPAATPGLKEIECEGDLYSVGIDAHPGPSTFHGPSPSIEKPWPKLPVEAGKLVFRTPSYSPEAGEQLVEATRSTDANAGVSSGRRISSHNRIQMPGSLPETPSRHSSLFQRLGLGSAFIPGMGPSSRQRANTPQTDIVRRSSSVEMMKAILETQQTATIKRRETVVGRQSRLGAVDTCSEDGRPHLCTDDSRTPSYSVAGQARQGS